MKKDISKVSDEINFDKYGTLEKQIEETRDNEVTNPSGEE